MKYKYLLLLLLMLPFVCGCNDSDDVNGIFTGKVWKLTYITKKNDHKPTYTGTWSANGESNAFSASVKGSESDPLGFSNKFVEGLNRATSYKGNYDNLFIYYKDEGGRDLCLVFHVDK